MMMERENVHEREVGGTKRREYKIEENNGSGARCETLLEMGSGFFFSSSVFRDCFTCRHSVPPVTPLIKVFRCLARQTNLCAWDFPRVYLACLEVFL